MGIAGVEPYQLALTMGTTGSGSTDSPAPLPTIADLSTPTRVDNSSSTMAVESMPPIDIDIDSLTTNFNINTSIDIDTASTTIIGIAVPTAIDATPSPTMVDITGLTVSNTTLPSIADFISALAIDPLLTVMWMCSRRPCAW
jgi:hypothetical protein